MKNMSKEKLEKLRNEVIDSLTEDYFPSPSSCSQGFCHKWGDENISCEECYNRRQEEFDLEVEKTVKEILNRE